MRLVTTVPALAMAIAAFSFAASAEERGCFIKAGDRVGFFGDSITEADGYARATELVFRHFHPEANAGFVNNGGSGRQLAGTRIDHVTSDDPCVITIMIGMNDAINSSWVRGMPLEAKVAEYKADLVELVRTLKGKEKTVVILTPTLTDESAEMSCFRIEGTRRLLKGMGKACEEVATEESVYCIPVQSEFESYQDTLPPFAQLRPDGVHPCARGHYQIARSLWTHLNLSGPLEGGRSVSSTPPGLNVTVALASNIISADADALDFTISTPRPAPATVTWSLGDTRGTASLNLTGKDAWTLALPEGKLPQADGQSVSLVMDIESEGARRVFIIDVFRKMVLHGKEGLASGTIADADAEGTPLCSYLFKKDGKGLIFETSVKKQEIVQSVNAQWPWGNGDAVTLYLDLRADRDLGGLGFDGNVFQVWFQPQSKPYFSPGFHPWSGKHMASIATAFGEATADGYKVGVQLAGRLNMRERFDVSDRDYIGFHLTLINAAAAGKQTWHNHQETDRQPHIFPGALALVDLNGKLNGDSICTVSVFPSIP